MSLYDTDYDDYLDDHQRNLLTQYRLNRSIPQPWYSIFVISYAVVISTAFISNSMALWSVFRRKEVLNPRNIFILKLALADLFLCCTMTFSAIDVLTKYWPFGKDSDTLCKCVKASPCFVVYMASITIVIIAMDRYRCIVHPNARQLTTVQAIFILPVAVMLALAMSLPVYMHTKLHVPVIHASVIEAQEPLAYDARDSYEYEPSDSSSDGIPWNDIAFCIEDWTTKGNESTQTIHDRNQRHVYSIFSLLLQFVIPFSVISLLYMMIYTYLRKNRMIRKEKLADKEKARRTNTMLFRISMVFCICWLPLNILGLVIDGSDVFKNNHETMLCAFIACHLIGMSSACINPMLYGYRYQTVRYEHFAFLAKMKLKVLDIWKLLCGGDQSPQVELHSVVIDLKVDPSIPVVHEDGNASISFSPLDSKAMALTPDKSGVSHTKEIHRITSVLVTRISSESGSQVSV